MIRSGISASEARRVLAKAFAAQGLDEAELDARVLVRHATGIDPAVPGTASDAPLDATMTACLEDLARRRLDHEPIARILGHREFHGHDFVLNRACLVPRPDTETVVEAALALISADRPARLLDLGTGPGTILLALLAERPRALGLGLDRSAEALGAARANAAALGLAERADFAESDWGSAAVGLFDLIVSNPPYIPSKTCDLLAPEVRDHDPRLALDGGPDGLDAYRAILGEALRLLAPGGHIVVELGIGQAAEVGAIARRSGLVVCGLKSDLSAIPRALVLRHAS
ncbi:peptide chain release factor N(5)-glutamine methyltransferase [Phreatobacter stygius]|uniref:Release factor glutamine methyltransferase n=1 Tax=Phreatobacter stygius TaxID=1940610 RepID=A0A4D7B954_9HYPH|nr:peptide chain release factor N(5)-glutamine methyltransferase [Phreatobacter stygius]QCI64592.1 peptide chain release factor N(5)-glutamine methyltransferase [Phreatobacter stygius]